MCGRVCLATNDIYMPITDEELSMLSGFVNTSGLPVRKELQDVLDKLHGYFSGRLITPEDKLMHEIEVEINGVQYNQADDINGPEAT
jgi:hypothetical protein